MTLTFIHSKRRATVSLLNLIISPVRRQQKNTQPFIALRMRERGPAPTDYHYQNHYSVVPVEKLPAEEPLP